MWPKFAISAILVPFLNFCGIMIMRTYGFLLKTEKTKNVYVVFLHLLRNAPVMRRLVNWKVQWNKLVKEEAKCVKLKFEGSPILKELPKKLRTFCLPSLHEVCAKGDSWFRHLGPAEASRVWRRRLCAMTTSSGTGGAESSLWSFKCHVLWAYCAISSTGWSRQRPTFWAWMALRAATAALRCQRLWEMHFGNDVTRDRNWFHAWVAATYGAYRILFALSLDVTSSSL